MAYCLQSDVVRTIGRLAADISVTSSPSLSDIDGFIVDRANQIDAVLASRGLAVPITAPAWFVGECARLNAEGAAASMHIAANVTLEAEQRSAGELLLKSFEDKLASWVKGEGIPVAVAVQEADLAVRSNATASDYDPQRNRPLFMRRRF